ncbi:MAG: hypothetical protein ACE5GL_07370 [Calditrichia bacterium]
MPVIETLTLLATSATAKSVAKFLFERIDNYVSEKFAGKAEGEVARLKQEVEDLKYKLEAKSDEDVSQSDLDELKATLSEIEEDQSPLPADIVSPAAFQKWSEKDLDIVDQAIIMRKQLEILVDKAGELNMPDMKKFQLQQLTATLQQNITDLKESRFTSRLTGMRDDREREKSLGILIRKNIFQARDFLKGY